MSLVSWCQRLFQMLHIAQHCDTCGWNLWELDSTWPLLLPSNVQWSNHDGNLKPWYIIYLSVYNTYCADIRTMHTQNIIVCFMICPWRDVLSTIIASCPERAKLHAMCCCRPSSRIADQYMCMIHCDCKSRYIHNIWKYTFKTCMEMERQTDVVGSCLWKTIQTCLPGSSNYRCISSNPSASCNEDCLCSSHVDKYTCDVLHSLYCLQQYFGWAPSSQWLTIKEAEICGNLSKPE